MGAMSGAHDLSQHEVSSSTPLMPELFSLLDHLNAAASSSSAGPYVPDRARALCRLVQEGQKLVLLPGDGVGVLRHVFRLLFSKSPSARKGARVFLEAAKEPFPGDFDMSEMTEQLGGEGEYHKWMLAEILAGSVDGLKAWQVTIRLLGKIVHQPSGTSLLNSLLAIAEKGFKSDDIQLRRETFQAWQVLIDNFASNENILLHPKRIRLITRPLVANNNVNKEPLAVAKFNAWWHFICKLGPNAVSNVDNVIVPFLEFCYGRSHSEPPSALSSSKSGGSSSSHATTASPVKKFGTMSSQCLDAFAQILGCDLKKKKQLAARLNLGGKTLEVKDVVAHQFTILHAVTEAFNSVNVADDSELEKFEAVFVAVANIIHSIGSSDKVEDVMTVRTFLRSIHGVIAESKQHPQVHPVILTMMEEIRKLPSSVLLARYSAGSAHVGEDQQQQQPLSSMLRLLVDPDLLPNFASSANAKLRKQTVQVFQGFLKKGCASKVFALPLLEEVSSSLGKCLRHLSDSRCRSDVASTVWQLLASHLKEHIDRHQEINQTGSSLSHDFGACISVLSFPFDFLPDDPERNLWRQWVDLYAQVASAAALVSSCQPLEVEGKLCKGMVQRLRQASSQQQLENFATILSNGIVREIPFKTMADKESTKEGFGWIVEAATSLISKLPTTIQDTVNYSTAAKGICTAVSALLLQSSSQALLQLLLKKLVPCLVPLLKQDLMDAWGRDYTESAEGVFNSVLTLLQSRYKGSFDKLLLQDLLPFLASAMSHQRKRHLKQKALQMWQVTFAPTLALADIPPEISVALRKSLVLSSESSQSTVSTDEESSSSSVPAGPAFSSFFKKVEVKQTPSPFKSFKRPERSCSKKSAATLEDDSSSDFVPITNSGKKRRPLTDHQKEKLTARSDDIPALYSELSRDDSQAAVIPAQFSSQQSQDESSQAAMDESTFQILADQVRRSRKKGLSAEHSASPALDEEAQLAESSPESSSNKRKGRPPIKNLLPLAKRQSGSVGMMPEKKKRGRPAKGNPAVTKVETAVAVPGEIGSPVSVEATPVQSQEVLLAPAEVKINRLSPTQDVLVTRSPVKILQENPLVIVCAQEKPGCSEATGSVDRNNATDSEMIESSQSSDEPCEVRGRKRKRDSSSATLSDKNTNPQSVDSDMSKVQKAKRSLPLRRPADKENLVAAAALQQRPFRNSKNQYGETYLHVAVKKGDLERAKSLLESGADVHARDHAGWTPIHESIRNTPDALEIIKVLLDHGADINVQAENGNTPLHDAVKLSDRMIQFLLENGANARLANRDGVSPIDMAPMRLMPFLSHSSPKKPAAKSALLPHDDDRDNECHSNAEEADLPVTIGGITPLSLDEGVQQEATESVAQDSEPSNAVVQAAPTSAEAKEAPAIADASGPSIQAPTMATFTRLHEKQLQRRGSLPMSGRGAKLLEMSKAKGHVQQDKEEVTAPPLPLMSPKVTATTLFPVVSSDNLTTPTSHHRKQLRPWEKFQPSPSDASPSTSILKKCLSESDGGGRDSPSSSSSAPPPVKRRRVQFKEPPVSDRVEIPRCPASVGDKSARPRLAAPRFNKEIPLLKSFSCEETQQQDSDSSGLYVSTPPVDASDKEPIYPGLVDCEEPVTSILAQLANQTWQKAAEKSLTESGVTKISQLSKLTPLEAKLLKGLKPPDNVLTIQDALRRFEKKRETRLSSLLIDQQCRETEDIFKKIAPVVDVSTPEEDEQTMQELYERPSPSPTEHLASELSSSSETAAKAITAVASDIGPPPPLICLNPERADLLQLNIPTIVFASSPSKQRGSSPREQWTLNKDERSQLHKECQASVEAPLLEHKECQASLNEEGPMLLHKESQASPPKVVVVEAACLTDAKETSDTEVQAVAACCAKETQTRANDMEEDMSAVLLKVEEFDSRMLGEVMQKCLMLMRSKM